MKRMSAKTAMLEAKRRWGKGAFAAYERDYDTPEAQRIGCYVGSLVDDTYYRKGAQICVKFGTGNTFEEAFQSADANEANRDSIIRFESDRFRNSSFVGLPI